MMNLYPNPYFEQLNSALKKYPRALPMLLIDLDRIDHNITQLKKDLKPSTAFRVAVKSLPSFELIQYVMQEMNTDNLMVFHQPFLSDLSSKLNNKADILLGKPMPVKTAKYYYENLPVNDNFNPYTQIQWLVDTRSRIQEYMDLAKVLGKKLRLNVEIDVGLHRGGFNDLKQLKAALQLIKDNPETVEFSGFMGYDPHIVNIPGIVSPQHKLLAKSSAFYEQCKDLVKNDFASLWQENLTFNGAGSPTLSLHKDFNSPLNDISAGSCLVMPTSFDIPSLKGYEPACFIATPVLKKFRGTTLPALEKIKGLLNIFSANNQQSFFIYGGYWKAEYCYPTSIKQNSIFSASTNQTMLNAPKSIALDVDDFVFLRPIQSEFVFLQFGGLLPVRKNVLKETWSLLRNQ